MVTENVTIVVRERGAAAASRGIDRIGFASRKATVAVVGLIAVLGGFLTIRGLQQIASDAIKTSAAFEQYGIQLSALLGSQREANAALETFTNLATRTPFAVSQIVQGATALGAAALGNREKLERLTATAANLAAITGISFQETANNLQRSLSAGIGAADLFRDKGVRALIEAIGGIPDATKLTSQELDILFDKVAGAEGIFGNAAEQLANTLGGALSNIGDAATNAQKALGDALAPSVVNTAKQAFIPFLQDMEQLFKDNADSISQFAADMIQFAIPAMVSMVRVGLTLVLTFAQVVDFGRDVAGALLEIHLAARESRISMLEFGNSIGVISDGRLALEKANVEAIRDRVDELAKGSRDATKETEELERNLTAVSNTLEGLSRKVQGTVFSELEQFERPDIELPEADPNRETSEQITKREAAARRILQLTNQLRISSAARVSQDEATIERLEQQRLKLVEQATIAGNINLAREGLLEIEAQLRDIREKAGLEAEAERLAAAKALGQTLSTTIGESIRGAFLGEGLDAMDLMANLGADLVQNALDNAISTITESIEGVFTDLASSFGADLGGAFGSAIAGAIGVGIGILAAELGGTSARANNNLVQEAAENAQATRGVVAGPTSVPIFQFGSKLEEAMIPTNGLLVDILGALQNGQGGDPASSSVGGSTGSSGADLSLRTPSLV
jgi:hypothetical protein